MPRAAFDHIGRRIIARSRVETRPLRQQAGEGRVCRRTGTLWRARRGSARCSPPSRAPCRQPQCAQRHRRWRTGLGARRLAQDTPSTARDRMGRRNVDAVDSQDLVQVAQGLYFFDLDANQRFTVGLCRVFGHGQPIAIAGRTRRRCQPARALRMILDGLDDAAGVGCGVDVWHLHAHRPTVHHPQDLARIGASGTHDRRDAAGLCSHNHQLDGLERDRAMLAVDQHPVKAQTGDHLD